MGKRKRLHDSYQVGAGEARLRLIVGDGQIGTSLILLGTRQLASGNITLVSLGDGPDLIGQTLTVKTTVSDVQHATNRTSVTYLFEGGPALKEVLAKEDVEEDGDLVQYIAKFDLTGSAT